MKKGLLILAGLMVVISLSACGDKDVKNTGGEGQENGNVVEVENVSQETADEENVSNDVEATEKTGLTVSDLDEIDDALFPVSYSYEVYSMESDDVKDAGQSTYPDGWDHRLLLPIHSEMESREVISSEIQDGMIYTSVNLLLKDGSTASALYINDPDSLQYVAASVNRGDETILYIFNY